MKSMSRIEFFTTMPASRIIPIIDGMQPCLPASSMPHAAPMSASGMATMMVSGWIHDLNAGTSEK